MSDNRGISWNGIRRRMLLGYIIPLIEISLIKHTAVSPGIQVSVYRSINQVGPMRPIFFFLFLFCFCPFFYSSRHVSDP